MKSCCVFMHLLLREFPSRVGPSGIRRCNSNVTRLTQLDTQWSVLCDHVQHSTPLFVPLTAMSSVNYCGIAVIIITVSILVQLRSQWSTSLQQHQATYSQDNSLSKLLLLLSCKTPTQSGWINEVNYCDVGSDSRPPHAHTHVAHLGSIFHPYNSKW